MNIDEKIKKFEQSCDKLAEMDAEKLNEKINNEIEDQIDTELEEYINKQENLYKKQCENVIKDYNKSLFEYEVSCKKNIQNVKDIIKRELKEEIERKLISFIDMKEYSQYLNKNINDALNYIDNEKMSSVIFVTKRDYEKYNDLLKKYNLKIDIIDDYFIGGCKVKNDRLNIIIDNTLRNSLEEKCNF